MWYGAKALTPEPDLQWYDQVYVGYAESDDGRHWQRTETNNGHTFHGRPVPHRLSNIDHNVGRVLSKLDESGQTDRTLVVFTSDHGEMVGTHGHVEMRSPYEESSRVPLLVRAWPGVPRGLRHSSATRVPCGLTT